MPVPGWLYSYQEPAVKNVVKTLLTDIEIFEQLSNYEQRTIYA